MRVVIFKSQQETIGDDRGSINNNGLITILFILISECQILLTYRDRLSLKISALEIVSKGFFVNFVTTQLTLNAY